jgi:hypothetical protein
MTMVASEDLGRSQVRIRTKGWESSWADDEFWYGRFLVLQSSQITISGSKYMKSVAVTPQGVEK